MDRTKNKKYIFLFSILLIFLIIISASPAKGDEWGKGYSPKEQFSENSLFIGMYLNVKSRNEVSFRLDIFNWQNPKNLPNSSWGNQTFLYGFYSPAFGSIRKKDIQITAKTNEYPRKELIPHLLSIHSPENEIITLVLCELPPELSIKDTIEEIVVKGTFRSDQDSKSSIIGGDKANFPFDEYSLEFYTFFFGPKNGKTVSKTLEYKSEGEKLKTISSGTSLVEENVEKTITRIPGFKEVEKLQLKGTKLRLEYKTDQIGLQLSISWILSFCFTIIGVLFFFLWKKEKKSWSLQVLLTSAVLIWGEFLFYSNQIPKEINFSIAHIFMLNSVAILLIGFIAVVTGLYFLRNDQRIPKKINRRLFLFWWIATFLTIFGSLEYSGFAFTQAMWYTIPATTILLGVGILFLIYRYIYS